MAESSIDFKITGWIYYFRPDKVSFGLYTFLIIFDVIFDVILFDIYYIVFLYFIELFGEGPTVFTVK